MFQREPGWILPKGERDFTDEERAALRHTVAAQAGALAAAVHAGEEPVARAPLPARHQDQRRPPAVLPRLHRSQVRRPPRPAARPSRRRTRIPGKRPIFASTFYSALKKENVELVPRAVASVTRTGIVDADGVERAVDVIVMATGFQPANYLGPPARRRPRRPHAPGALGRRAARVPRHHGAGLPELLHALRTGHQRRRDRDRCSRARRSTPCGR